MNEIRRVNLRVYHRSAHRFSCPAQRGAPLKTGDAPNLHINSPDFESNPHITEIFLSYLKPGDTFILSISFCFVAVLFRVDEGTGHGGISAP
jgi:hypothetical protein